jgi:hypothetical protein
MKKFKYTVLGRILVGAGDAVTGGTVSNLVYSDEVTHAGQIDWKRAGASVATLVLILAFVSGKISLDTLKSVLHLID